MRYDVKSQLYFLLLTFLMKFCNQVAPSFFSKLEQVFISLYLLFENRIKPQAHLLPPLFFLATSIGAGRALTCLTGGGSCILSSFCSISASN